MAQVKRAPNADNVPGPFDSFNAEAFGQFAMTYWPAVLGGVALFILILAGKEKVAIPVAIGVLGMFDSSVIGDP
jgi:hypothetical protein